MPVDQIEMLWRCEDKGCNNENKGRFKTCQACGRPKTREDGFYLPGDISHAAAVTDEKMLRQAKGGEDWSCKYCGSKQFRADGQCAQCGVNRNQGEKRSTPLATSFEEPESPPKPHPLRKLLVWQPFAVAIGAGLFFWFFVWLFTPRQVEAKVQAVGWSTTIHVELYSKHWHDGFNPPGDAVDIHNEGEHIHHYLHVRTGSHQAEYYTNDACGQDCRVTPRSCYTTPRSCTSNKNGYATCSGGDRVCSGGETVCTTRYCRNRHEKTVDDYTEVPQYQPFYSWNCWGWARERNVTKAGADFTPVFGDPALQAFDDGRKERESGRETELDVRFSDGKESWLYHPANTDEFAQYTLGAKRRLKIQLGNVEVMHEP